MSQKRIYCLIELEYRLTVDLAHPFLIALVTRCLECGDSSEELLLTSKKECRGVEGVGGRG